MELTLARLCSQERSCYTLLREHTDVCAGLGRSYELPPCRLPEGCAPERASIGFWRTGRGEYVAYFKPAVEYRGVSRELADFFGSCPIRFPDFPSLVSRLRGLGLREEAPLPFPGLEAEFRRRFCGQAGAVETLSLFLRSHLCGGNGALFLLFRGPAGAGKSRLAELAAPVLNRVLRAGVYDSVRFDAASSRPVDISALKAELPQRHTVFIADSGDAVGRELLRRLAVFGGEEFRRCIFILTSEAGAAELPGDLAGRLTGTVGFAPPDSEDLAAEAARRAMALGAERGLTVVSVSPSIARYFASKPQEEAEAALSALFAEQGAVSQDVPLYLGGTPQLPRLFPA